MERFAAEGIAAERKAAIEAAVEAGIGMADLMSRFDLTSDEIEKILTEDKRKRDRAPDGPNPRVQRMLEVGRRR